MGLFHYLFVIGALILGCSNREAGGSDMDGSTDTDTNTDTDSRKPSRGCMTCLIVAIILTIAASFGIYYLGKHSQQQYERQRAEWRQKWYNDVKNGSNRVLIFDARLLPMLANDTDCVNNLEYLEFFMVYISPEDAKHVAQLVNVKKMTFYCTGGADDIFKALAGTAD